MSKINSDTRILEGTPPDESNEENLVGAASERNQYFSDDGEENRVVPDADTCVLSLQKYVEDNTKVNPSKQMNFIFMLALQSIEGFNVRKTVPYSKFVERSGYKKHVTFTKKTAVQELKRRSPAEKPNAKNQSIEQLLSKLQPLESEVNRQYVSRRRTNIVSCFLTNSEKKRVTKSMFNAFAPWTAFVLLFFSAKKTSMPHTWHLKLLFAP